MRTRHFVELQCTLPCPAVSGDLPRRLLQQQLELLIAVVAENAAFINRQTDNVLNTCLLHICTTSTQHSTSVPLSTPLPTYMLQDSFHVLIESALLVNG